MTHKRFASGAALVTALVLGTHALISAQVALPPAAKRVRTAPMIVGRLVTQRPLESGVGAFAAVRGSGGISVFGVVQNHLGVLVPSAGVVVLRELLTGRVVARASVNELAQFSFRGFPSGLYTAELIGGSGAVIASTPAFPAALGEVIQISQTIPTIPLQGVGRFLSSATSSALSSAASSGVLAVATGVPVSPGQ